jgi:predicted transcriptional regulator
MKRPKPIKPFKTLDEEANFWDTHDLSKIIRDPKTPLSELLSLKPEKDVVMTVRVQKVVKEKIEKMARIKGVNSTTLSRMWLIERLIKEDGGNIHAFA